MPNSQKGFVIPLVIAIIAILAVGGTVYLSKKEKVEAPIVTENYLPTQSTSTKVATSTEKPKVTPLATSTIFKPDFKLYSNTRLGIMFAYSKALVLSERNDEISLNHSIAYRNSGCDMKGDGVIYDRLSDFSITMSIDERPMANAISEPSLAEPYTLGTLRGKSVYIGAEGCGFTTYYFPISDSRTLVVKRNQVQEFSGAVTEEVRKKVLAVPGVISPEKANTIFAEILSSMRFTTPVIGEPVACTMDAFMCPDGTYVGRSGPRCQFICPKASTTTEVKIEQSITINGVKITPLEVTGDSRCPKATKCVWAGAVNLTARLQSGDMVQKADLTLGTAFKFDNKSVTLSKVTPEKTFVEIKPADYSFVFEVSSL